MNEKDFEDILVKYPELIEEGLQFLDRQVNVYGRRMDILFKDKFNRKLVIELKIGPIKDEHIGQILSYEAGVLSSDDPTARVMLIGNRVPPSLQKSLDHHGIAWKEIHTTHLKDFVQKKNDKDFLMLFDEEPQSLINDRRMPFKKEAMITKPQNTSDSIPALFTLVQGRWIDEALEYFKGKDKLYFSTNSNIREAQYLPIKKVYFKLTGDTTISAVADFIGLDPNPPMEFRLRGKDSWTGKYYYGFKNLKRLKNEIELQDLKHYKTEQNLRNDVPSARIIIDPEAE